MKTARSAGMALAATISLCLLATAGPARATFDVWRQDGTRPAPEAAALVQELQAWLDAESGYTRRKVRPEIRVIHPMAAQRVSGRVGRRARRSGGHVRGLYDPDGGTIFLVHPWSPDDPHDASVLLHELVHHRQVGARHWYCPGQQEADAYALQAEWLGERGLEARANPIAVALEAGCVNRDIHPE